MSLDTDFYTEWQVVINEEEQYSVWPVKKTIPTGWRSVKVSGSKKECLEHIDCTWTDMRPLSLRKEMASREEAT